MQIFFISRNVREQITHCQIFGSTGAYSEGLIDLMADQALSLHFCVSLPFTEFDQKWPILAAWSKQTKTFSKIYSMCQKCTAPASMAHDHELCLVRTGENRSQSLILHHQAMLNQAKVK